MAIKESKSIKGLCIQVTTIIKSYAWAFFTKFNVKMYRKAAE